jgi:hypothetical protein
MRLAELADPSGREPEDSEELSAGATSDKSLE